MEHAKPSCRRSVLVMAAVASCGTWIAVAAPPEDSATLETLYSFKGIAGPPSTLTFHNGLLYGTTNSDGLYGAGTVFELAPPSKSGGSWRKAILYEFQNNPDGAYPSGPVAFDAAGAMYGTTSEGGVQSSSCVYRGCGIVYKLTPPVAGGQAWVERILHTFQGPPDGDYPVGRLAFDKSGAIYGATYYGGSSYGGIVFQLVPNNGEWTENILYNTVSLGSDGVVLDDAGNLYGSDYTAIFELSPPADGGSWIATVLSSALDSPPSNLVRGSDGSLYGTATGGNLIPSCPDGGCGIVFQVAPPAQPGGAWQFSTIYEFTGGQDGACPQGVTIDQAGSLYGITSSSYCYGMPAAVYHLAPPAQPGGSWTFNILYDFPSVGTVGVTLGTQGEIFGVEATSSSGLLHETSTVFELTPPSVEGESWNESSLFGYAAASDGSYPQAGMVFDTQGTMYGVTKYCGTGIAEFITTGAGTIYQLVPPASGSVAWTETVLHSFAKWDGSGPNPGLWLANDGSVYGTTADGGPIGCGVVFQVTPPSSGKTWTESSIYTFSNVGDGCNPAPGLVADKNGNFYGATGTTVFELTPPSSPGGFWTETTLYSFPTRVDAQWVVYHNGSLYGIVPGQGDDTIGTVFQLTPPVSGTQWTYSVLHTFPSQKGDSAGTGGGVVFDDSGELYGVTPYGGTNNAGTVFRLTPPASPGGAWGELILYSFQGGSDGSTPTNVEFLSGRLIGATQAGGIYKDGILFELTPPSGGSGAWTETILHTFSGGDGQDPKGVVIHNGTVYGAASAGTGPNYNGTIFQLTP